MELDGVADGGAASDAFLRLTTGDFDENETQAVLRSALLRYCYLDTFAMVELHQALRSTARGSLPDDTLNCST